MKLSSGLHSHTDLHSRADVDPVTSSVPPLRDEEPRLNEAAAARLSHLHPDGGC